MDRKNAPSWYVFFFMGIPCRHFIFSFLLLGTLGISAEKVSFSRQIAPILSDNCYKCHGPDAENNQSEFRVDTFENATTDLGGYAGIVPHNLEASRAIETILSSDPEVVMPPPESHLKLTDQEISLLKQWVEEGAEYEKHWTFTELPKSIPVPEQTHERAKNEIDHFISDQLLKNDFTPSPDSTRESWIRRVTFDLTGLPPTLEEMNHFQNDSSPEAYEKVVDRLLTSPAYGERLATEWLDVARYADSYGYQVDRHRVVWQWRDWVVNSFNMNLSYKDFILHQLAGDLIPEATRETRLATTFNRLHGQKNEGGSIPEEFRQAYISDRVNTVGTAFLGLTMDCTKCHDHKYDPLTQKDYFSMAAFFSNIDESGLYAYMQNSVPTPTLALSTPDQENQLAAYRQKIQQVEQQLASIPVDYSKAPLDPVVTLDLSQEKGGGRLLNGDHAVNLTYKPEDVVRGNPYTFSVTYKAPEEYERAYLMGTSRATLDSCYRGFSMIYEDGRLTVILSHYYPGDSLEIITQEKLPTDRFMNITLTYDGSSQAQGLRLYLDGQPLATEIRYDNLTGSIFTNKDQKRIPIGAISRDKGLKGAVLKNASFYHAALTPAQVVDLTAGNPIYQIAPNRLAKEQELYAARKAYNDLENKVERIMTMRETERKDIPYVKTHILNRGMYNEPTEEVQPAFPAVLSDFGWNETAQKRRLNRLDFAQWLIHPDHPLTARVTVNRYWQMFFGNGLIKTSEDFGLQAAPPVYPDLLDWLARDFINSEWNLHHLIKKITLSHTYRQASARTPDLVEKDPENTFLSHFPPLPLTAEMLRDNALAQSGLMEKHLGGGSQYPYDLAESFKPSGHARNKGPGQYRRSLYTHWQVNGPSPLMLTLDSSKRDVCSVKRETTSTPLRSLVLMNSPQFVEAARACANSLLLKKEAAPHETAFHMLTSRPPREEEARILTELYREQRTYFASAPAEATELLNVGFFEEDASIPQVELAALTNTILTILNHDEAQMKY